MEYNFRNLVFEGGGVKGIGYIGALEGLCEKNILRGIERVGGASSGAIIALLLALDYDTASIKKIIWEMDFEKFKDDSAGIIRDTERLLNEFGWYKGDYFRNWIGGLIEQKTGSSESTFFDLEKLKGRNKFREPYFIATNLSTRFSEIFSNEHTPDTKIADAIRMSMSIPVFFAAKRVPGKGLYVDAGVQDAYPVKLFDRKKYLETKDASGKVIEIRSKNWIETDYYNRINESSDGPDPGYVYNKETLGFRLDTKSEISVFRDHKDPKQYPIDNFYEYTKQLIETLIAAQDNAHLHDDDWQRTVYIDSLNVKTTEFNISNEEKTKLIESGRKGIQKYFEWFDDDSQKVPPINK